MQVTSTTAASNASALDTLNAQNNAMGKKTLDQGDFFKLLTAQLASQDPLKPMDDMSFISQMASFSSLQEMQTLSGNISSFTQQQGLANASNYLGKTVTVMDEAGLDLTGVVSSIGIDMGVPMLTINGKSYGVDAVKNVTSTLTPTNSASSISAQ